MIINSFSRMEEKCSTVLKSKYIKKRRPICTIEVIGLGSGAGQNDNKQMYPKTKQEWLKCKIGLKRMKIKVSVKKCKTVPKVVEKCRKTIRIMQENHEKKVCSYLPKKICHNHKESKANKPTTDDP